MGKSIKINKGSTPIDLCNVPDFNNENIEHFLIFGNYTAGESNCTECVTRKITKSELAEVFKSPEKKLCELNPLTEAQVGAANSAFIVACIDDEEVKIPLSAIVKEKKLCELDSLTEAQVGAATQSSIIACIDDEEVKIPLSAIVKEKKLCELDSLTEAQVDAAGSAFLVACVDDKEVKVPLSSAGKEKKLCELNFLSKEKVGVADEVFLVACADNKEVKIPLSVIPDEKKLCELDSLTEAQVEATDGGYVIACIDDKEVKIPLSTIPKDKKFCDLKSLTEAQVGAATESFLMACIDGEEVKIPLSVIPKEKDCKQDADNPPLNIDDVANLYNNLKVNVFYETGDCPTFREINFDLLSKLILNGMCILAGDNINIKNENNCLTISADQKKLCDLEQATKQQVDSAGSVLTAACVDGKEMLVPPCCLSPIIIEDNKGNTWATCVTITAETATPVFDSRTGLWDSNIGGAPSAFNVTNPTDQPAMIIIDAQFNIRAWQRAYNADSQINGDWNVLYAIGEKFAIDQIGVIATPHTKYLGDIYTEESINRRLAFGSNTLHKTSAAAVIPRVNGDNIIENDAGTIGQLTDHVSLTIPLAPKETKTLSAFWMVRGDKRTQRETQNFYGGINYKTVFVGYA